MQPVIGGRLLLVLLFVLLIFLVFLILLVFLLVGHLSSRGLETDQSRASGRFPVQRGKKALTSTDCNLKPRERLDGPAGFKISTRTQ